MTKLLTGKWLLRLTAVVVLLGGFALLGQLIDLEEALNPQRIAELLEAAGPLAPLVLIGINSEPRPK